MPMEQRTLSEQTAKELLVVHEDLLRGCLKSLQLQPRHPHYEDYLQVAKLALLNAYCRFPQPLDSETTINQFAGYAYTGARWAVLDALRKAARHDTRKAALTDEVIAYALKKDSTHTTQKVDFFLWFKEFWRTLTDHEQQFLIEKACKDQNMTQIARTFGKSRQHVYRLRQKYKKNGKNQWVNHRQR